MRVFVTGATGFVGSALVLELLQAGHQVLGLARPGQGAGALIAAGAEFLRGELEDLDSVRRGAAMSDGVIHTAFHHDFSEFARNSEVDRRATVAMGAVIQGTDQPLEDRRQTPGKGNHTMSKPTHAVHEIPVSPPTPVVSVAPVVLPAPGRAVDLQIRVSAPVTGGNLPIILLSHGHGSSNHLSSLNGYAPLAHFWAAHGFVVIQPTHLSSKTLQGKVDPNGPEGPLFWRSRAEDMRRILDHLDAVEDAVPEVRGRLDRGRIAVAGHSLGGLTVSMLLGVRVPDENGSLVDLSDARITAGVVMAAPGDGALLNGPAGERFPFMKHLDFAGMTAPALVVVGDRDVNPAFSDRVEYRAGAYTLSPSPKSLLTLFGAEHILGGISGYDAAETTDENPERVEVLGRLTWAYLRTALYPDDLAWSTARSALMKSPDPLGRIESR